MLIYCNRLSTGGGREGGRGRGREGGGGEGGRGKEKGAKEVEGEMRKEKWKQCLHVKIMFYDLPIITYNYHYNIMQ